jgi:hypothetical protein
MRWFKQLLLLAVVVMLPGASAWAEDNESVKIADHDFPKTIALDGTILTLKSGTHYRYMRMFDVLSAGIYLPQSVAAKDFVKPGSKALRLCYDRAFSADEFSKVTVDFMTDNNPLEVVKAVAKEIDVFNKLYQAVVPGDCYALVFGKGQGLSFYKNDVLLGKPGKDKFAEAVFRIWFGPEPFSKGMRDDLLEGTL